MLKVHDKINRKQGKDNSNWGKTFCNMTQMRSYISTTEIASKCRHANTVKPMGERLKKKHTHTWYRNKKTIHRKRNAVKRFLTKFNYVQTDMVGKINIKIY